MCFIDSQVHFEAIEKRILGYIRVMSLNEFDYSEIVQSLDKGSFIPPKDINVAQWIHYAADSAVFDYYTKKEKQIRQRKDSKPIFIPQNEDYIKKMKYRCMDLFVRMSGNERFFKEKCKKRYRFPYSQEDDDLLYDLIFIFEEVLQDILSINLIDSRPNERLIFCFKYLVDGWSSKDILKKLRKRKLINLLMDFINDYSLKSGLPSAAVLFYFYPLEEDLYRQECHDAKLNSYFSPIDVKGFINSSEKRNFMKSITTQRVNLIDKWCERTRERIINKIIEY